MRPHTRTVWTLEFSRSALGRARPEAERDEEISARTVGGLTGEASYEAKTPPPPKITGEPRECPALGLRGCFGRPLSGTNAA